MGPAFFLRRSYFLQVRAIISVQSGAVDIARAGPHD
jgi:hypothetical protein